MNQLQWLFHEALVEVRAWMNDYILLFYVDIITYPCLNIHAGLANLCCVSERFCSKLIGIGDGFDICLLSHECVKMHSQNGPILLIWIYVNANMDK